MAKEFKNLLGRARESSELLKALSHELRLMALCFISTGERTVQELESLLETSQSNLSQHLAKLRSWGVLEARKDGNQVFYRIKDRRVLHLIESLESAVCSDNLKSGKRLVENRKRAP
ncbi:MAG: hypothetical protein A2X94_13760 [Bdellovibrionales bacterium GWB1_55_8]|nr:MAG: hypothetical protein A2X94_13760 [Bdellovibrionales bacterium GWB1_55_8]